MKQFLLFISFLVTANLLFAQSIKIVSASDLSTDISGTEVDAVGSISDLLVSYDMRVINTSGQDLTVYYKRKRIANTGRTDQICDEYLCLDADDAFWYDTPNDIPMSNSTINDTTILKPQVVTAGERFCGIHVYYVVNSDNDEILDSVTIKFRTDTENCFLSIEDDIEPLKAFNLFPNPAKSNVTIENLNPSDEKIFIFDALGKILITEDVNHTIENVSLSSLKSGIYFVRIQRASGKMSETKKLIVKK
jgi:hypothetical protein